MLAGSMTPAALALAPYVTPVEPAVAFTECRTFGGVTAKLGHLTVIAGPPKSGKTHQLHKLAALAKTYNMPLLHRDLSFPVELDAVFEYMFGRGRYLPEQAYAITWPDYGMLAKLTLDVLERCSLHYAGVAVPVIAVRLPVRNNSVDSRE